jgi:hypothetical protein
MEIRHVLTFNLDDFENLPDVIAVERGVPSPNDPYSTADGGLKRPALSSPVSAGSGRGGRLGGKDPDRTGKENEKAG